MARFFVGQRVRFVASRYEIGRKFIGQEARIVAAIPDPRIGINSEFGVVFDSGATASVCAYQLEPTIPSGHQPAELTVEELLPFLKTREVA